MKKLTRLASVLVVFAGATAWSQEASPTNIAKMLEKSRQASAKDALELLQKSLEMAGQGPLTPAERADLAGQFVRSISHHKFTMDQIDQALAGKSKRRIARQIYYQRYLEQWHVEQPLQFRVVWDCPKGQEPSLRLVTATTP